MNKLSVQTLSAPFYRANAVFFMIAIYLAFGLMRGVDHIAIAQTIAASLPLSLAAIALLSAYVLKTCLFIRNLLMQPSYRIIHEAALFPPKEMWAFLASAQLSVNIPALLYAFFVMYFQGLMGEWGNLLVFLIFIPLSVVAPCLLYRNLLYGPLPEKKFWTTRMMIDKKIHKPQFTWFFFHLADKKPGNLFLSKLLSFASVAAFALFNATGDYDWRVIGLGALFTFGANLPLMMVFNDFDKKDMAVFRNVPVGGWKRIMNVTATWFLLLTPEFLLSWRLFPTNQPVEIYLYLMGFGYAFCLGMVHIPLLRNWKEERLIQLHFFIFVFLFIYILYGFSLIPMIGLFAMVFLYGRGRYHRLIVRSE